MPQQHKYYIGSKGKVFNDNSLANLFNDNTLAKLLQHNNLAKLLQYIETRFFRFGLKGFAVNLFF